MIYYCRELDEVFCHNYLHGQMCVGGRVVSLCWDKGTYRVYSSVQILAGTVKFRPGHPITRTLPLIVINDHYD